MTRTLEFWFWFGSTYSYLSAMRPVLDCLSSACPKATRAPYAARPKPPQKKHLRCTQLHRGRRTLLGRWPAGECAGDGRSEGL